MKSTTYCFNTRLCPGANQRVFTLAQFFPAFLLTLCLCFAAKAQVTMTDIGPTAPTPGSTDVVQTNNAGDTKFPDNLNYYTDNGANNGRYAGQTFTTGTNSAGYVLESVSIFTAGIDDGGGYNNSQEFHLFLYSVSGSTATLMQSFALTSQFTDGDWVQWTNLALPVQANSTYAYAFGRDSSGSGWAGLGNANGNPYAGGQIAMIPPTGGTIAFGASGDWDATFEIGLSTNVAQVPPQITQQPASITVYSNAVATFKVGLALSSVSSSFQWLKGSSPLPGQTNSALTLTHAQNSDIAGYSVVVTNIYGATTSSVANLSLISLPTSLSYKSTVLSNGPVGYWPLDLTVDTGSTASDLSGYGNTGTYVGITSANKVSGPSSYLPNAAGFNGTNAYVDLSTGSDTALLNIGGQITMEAWVLPATHGSLMNIIAKGYDAGKNFDEVEMRENNGTFDVTSETDASGNQEGVQGAGVASSNNWTHLIGTYDGANWNVYTNGFLASSSAGASGAIAFADSWAIGDGTASGNGRFFDGDICQVSLYTNALTPVQVYLHYLAGEYDGSAQSLHLTVSSPANESVYTNGLGTFTVNAANAVSPSYQWYQVSGGVTNAIAGATNSSYTTPPVTSAMNGTGYFAIAYDTALGTTASSTTAILTVIAGSPDTVSVQFQPYGDGAESTDLALSPTDKTGAFPTTNWNVLPVNVRPASSATPQPFYGLKDKNGYGSAMQLSLVGISDGWTANQPAPDNAPITKLLNSFVKAGYGPNWPNFPNTIGNGLDQFVFSNLDNTQTYDIYVYLLANDDANFPDIDAGSGVTNFAGDEFLGVNQQSNFVASLNQDPSAYGTLNNRDAGNFVRVSGISPSNGVITVSVNYDDPANSLFNPNSGSGVGVCGLQIVKSSVDTFPVTIITQPSNQRAVTNTPATFSVGAVGVPLPSYQWYEVVGGNTNTIAGATNATYVTPPVQDSDTGEGFFVAISNSLNVVTSSTAILTAGHSLTGNGFLEADEYFGNYSTAGAALTTLYPFATGMPAPNKSEYLRTFNDNADLPNNAGERIYGWFTPPVTGNYVFFDASDDAAVLWLSTNSSPTNVYEIAQNQDWMTCGNDGPPDWLLSNTGSGEYPFFSTGEWRSDQFEVNNGPNSIASFITGSWQPWPGVNSDGSIPLTAGQRYYIELDHYEGNGGQGAAVTYKLAGNPDPTSGSSSLLSGGKISAQVPDSLQPPIAHIQIKSISGSNVTLGGSNGLVNAVYHVLSSPDITAPLSTWTVVASGRLDSSGNFTATFAKGSDNQRFYIIQVSP
ncbi:MAG TPA: LamG-like jellyroll fold domain-containing protein [Verrucomicrobiae bacterium]|nr:LamG-like jellyroll fold domain-containing protein [Verrucomicrobiae bacterium]